MVSDFKLEDLFLTNFLIMVIIVINIITIIIIINVLIMILEYI